MAPHHIGIAFIEIHLHDVGTRHPATAAAVGGGSTSALVPGKGIIAQREPDDVIHTYVALSRPPQWGTELDLADAKATTARIAAEFQG